MSYICRLCGFETMLDDLIAPAKRRGICLHCYYHAVGDKRHVSKAVMRQIDTEMESLKGAKLPPDPRLAYLQGGTP